MITNSVLSKTKSHFGLLAITAIYLLTILYMLPFYNQTYNDDFAYIQSVRDFLATGNFKISDWAGASLIFPMYWGVLFSKLFGYSPAVLVFSTAVLLYPGLVAFYFLLKRLGYSQFRSTAFTLFLLGFPWILQFTYTFQTDIPYMSLMIISLLFYILAIQKGNNLNFFLGSLFAAFAYLTRQLGSSMVIGVLLVLLLEWRIGKRVTFLNFLFSAVPFIALILPYQIWVSQPGNAPYSLELQSSPDWFKNELLPNLFPVDLNYLTGTNRYYAKFIYRTLLYFHQIVAFLLPFFLLFKFRLKGLSNYIKKNKLSIFISISVYYLLFSVEYFLHYEDNHFEFLAPDRITIWSSFLPFDLSRVWQISAILSSPIFAVIFGASLKKVFSNFIKPSKSIVGKRAKLLLILFSIFLILFWLRVFTIIEANAITYSFSSHGLDSSLRQLSKLLFSPIGSKFLHDSWLVLTVWWLIVAGMLIFYKKFHLANFGKSFERLGPENFFIIMVFLIQFCLVVFLGNVHVPQYIISFIPFVVIWLAFISKNWRINYFVSVVILIAMVSFSTRVTKNRYVDNGIRFELGTKLVSQGVEPYFIEPHEWSWLPWWYYESTFAEATKKVGGDKYKVKELGTFYVYADIVPKYSVLQIPVDYKYSDNPNLKVVEDSRAKYFDPFTKVRYIVVERGAK